MTKRHKLQLLLPTNKLALVRRVQCYLRRCDGQWSVTVVMRIVTPTVSRRPSQSHKHYRWCEQLISPSLRWVTRCVCPLRCTKSTSSLWATARDSSGLVTDRKKQVEKAKVMGRGNKPGLPVSVALGFCVFVCVVKGCLQGLRPWWVKIFGSLECDEYKT